MDMETLRACGNTRHWDKSLTHSEIHYPQINLKNTGTVSNLPRNGLTFQNSSKSIASTHPVMTQASMALSCISQGHCS